MKEYICFRGHPVSKITGPGHNNFAKYYCKICKKHYNDDRVTEKIHVIPKPDYTRQEYLD